MLSENAQFNLTKAAVRDRCDRIVGWVTDVYEVPQTFRRQTDKNGNFTRHNLNIGSLDVVART